MKYIRLLILALLPLCLAAKNVGHFYIGSQQVADHTQATRDLGIQAAFTEVLIRVSGNEQVTTIPEIQSEISNAKSYMQRYGYHGKQLRVEFDSTAVNHLLKNAQQPIWTKERPLTIVWLAHAGLDDEPSVISSSSTSQLLDVLNTLSAKRGLPIIFPTMDLQDLSYLSAETVWALDQDAIKKASKRYDAQNHLVIRMEPYLGQWRASCLYLLDDQVLSWQVRDEDEVKLLGQVFNRMAEELLAQFVSQQGLFSAQHLYLHVLDVNDLDDYAKVVDYVRSLVPVKNVEVVQINGNDLLLDVTANTDSPGLIRSIKLAHGHKLKMLDYSDTLRFRWTPRHL